MLNLTPRIDPIIQSLLDDRDFLAQLLDALGSPLALVLPQQVTKNVTAFRETYRRHHLSGRLYYAHKANRSSALLRELAAGDTGVDVASLGELQHALGAGFTPDRIVATGPKNREFLWLAARAGATVSADSHDELAELAGIVAGHRLPRVPVSLRLSGFASPGVRLLTRGSRFGTPTGELPDLLDLLEKRADQLALTGVAYHLDTIGLPEKAVALENCLTALDECRTRGLRPRSLDIGGGFGVSYLADRVEWDRYTTELGQAVLGRRAPMTWHGHGYGLRAEGGTLRGSLALYPGYRPVSGAAYLDRLLGTPAPERGRPLGELLLDHMYDLDVEPGRALLDQCGLILARVVSVLRRDDEILVQLDINARDVSLEEHGVLMDPVVLPRAGDRRAGPAGVYLLGNLCLETDLITRRKVYLPVVPRPGDLLAFVNTAGYFMDFSATRALHQPVARKVAVYRTGGVRRWCLDEQYWPVHPRQEVS
ncbi:diaminopimelate decarboxylase [Actinoplanes regularis]|uniref:Diaminopimelate decarboxylase n=1 Tax=Actinoplanes regularis TaxID=52697 RepID=A0A239I4A7_9ACTN|nr:diaminopimelate decarboxylase [Actinoplanes regularis]GIE91367.1 diaminopimelate decarboxylase [Actinoplanes regularis]SNS88321.1 diaminopimelate decarboxylase [Actinoplanes regularis]